MLPCDSRPIMKSRYWLSCVRRGGPLLRHWVIGHRLAVILTGALARNWREGEAICLPELYLDSEGRSRDWGTVGCIVRLACLAI